MKHSLSPLYINLTKAEDTSVCLRMHISTKVNLKKKKSLIQQHKQNDYSLKFYRDQMHTCVNCRTCRDYALKH